MRSGFAVGGSDLDILIALTAESSRREEGAWRQPGFTGNG